MTSLFGAVVEVAEDGDVRSSVDSPLLGTASSVPVKSAGIVICVAVGVLVLVDVVASGVTAITVSDFEIDAVACTSVVVEAGSLVVVALLVLEEVPAASVVVAVVDVEACVVLVNTGVAVAGSVEVLIGSRVLTVVSATMRS